MTKVLPVLLVAQGLFAEVGASKLSRELDNDELGVIVEYKDGRTRNARHAGRTRRADLVALAADPTVKYVHPDRKVFLTDFNGKLDYGWMTVTGITAKTGTLPYDGTGIGVAVIDSGISLNRDFRDASGASRFAYRLCTELRSR